MQQSSLSILVDEKKVNDLLRQRTGATAFLRSAFNFCFFVFFLLLYTGLALSEPLAAQRAFEAYIRKRFDTEAAFPLGGVQSISTFWMYTQNSLFPALYGNDTAKYFYPGRVVDVFLPIDDNGNRLLGTGARARMIKIKPNIGCQMLDNLHSYFPTCFGPYDSQQLVTDNFGPNDDNGNPYFVYYGPRSIDRPYQGQLATYQPGGYMEILNADYNTTKTKFNRMMKQKWLGAGLRAIMYDFTIYNFNLGMYGVCSISFEVAPSGKWITSFSITMMQQRSLNPLGGGSSEELALLALEMILILCVIRYLMEETSEFLACDKRANSRFRIPRLKYEYFLDTWNVLDWVNLLLIIVALISKVSTWSLATERAVYSGNPKGASVLTFTDYSVVAAQASFVRSLTAFNTVLTWFKAVKYISVVPYITLFMQTIIVMQRNLISWIVLFVTSLIGFVVAFSSAYGQNSVAFRDVGQTLVLLVRSYFGDANINEKIGAAPLLGSILFVLFILVTVFIEMNMFHAIVLNGLSDAKAAIGGRQFKEWKRTVEKANEFFAAYSRKYSLETKFRQTLPGLYVRIMRRKRRREDKEKLRDENEARKEALQNSRKLPADVFTGAGVGRRHKRGVVQVGNDYDNSSSDESEPDLGPLRSQDQITGEPPLGFDVDKSSGFAYGADLGEDGKRKELDSEAYQLLVDATRHVTDNIVEHALGIRTILYRDMTESRDVLQGIANVLDVLGKRARSLEAQQTEVLRHL